MAQGIATQLECGLETTEAVFAMRYEFRGLLVLTIGSGG